MTFDSIETAYKAGVQDAKAQKAQAPRPTTSKPADHVLHMAYVDGYIDGGKELVGVQDDDSVQSWLADYDLGGEG